jgi:hypothetical protein
MDAEKTNTQTFHVLIEQYAAMMRACTDGTSAVGLGANLADLLLLRARLSAMPSTLMRAVLLSALVAFANASVRAADERPAIHGMLMVGNHSIYLSHLPMFMSPHDYQAIVEVDLGPQAQSVYIEDRKSHPQENIYTFEPEERFILPEMIRNPRPFLAKIYRGHFERGGVPIAQSVTVNIKKVLEFAQFKPDAPKAKSLDYILFGNGRELFLAHVITAKPDFDQVLGLDVDDDKLKSEIESQKQVVLEIPGASNDKPLSTGEPVHAIALQANTRSPLTLKNLHEYYLEFGDLSH